LFFFDNQLQKMSIENGFILYETAYSIFMRMDVLLDIFNEL